MTRRGRNLTNRRKINLINEITSIKNIIRHLVDAIQPSQSGISHNSPTKIDVEGAISYEVFQDYLSLKMNVSYM